MPVPSRGLSVLNPRTVGWRRTARAAGGALSLLAAMFAMNGCSSAVPVGYAAKPSGSESQMSFGVKMAQRGLWDEALFRFEQAQTLDPSSATGYNNIAVALEALGRYDAALESYQKGLRIEPNNAELKRNYARFVEFYQNFKPDEEAEEAVSEETPGEEAASEETAREEADGDAADGDAADDESAESARRTATTDGENGGV